MPEPPTAVPTTVFRAASADDVDAVVALVESAYRGEASRLGWTTEADLLDGQRTDADEVRRLLERPGSRILLAEDDGALLGCCHLEVPGDGPAYFGMFAVRPDLQGRGTGRALLRHAESTAAAGNATRVRMTVLRQRRDLIAWYERLGYARTGATEQFPYGDERFGRPRRDDLVFEILERSLDGVG